MSRSDPKHRRRRRSLPELGRGSPPRTSAPAAAAAIAARGGFGSRWPAARRRGRSTRRWSSGVDWTRTDVFFGDERAVPPDDPQSNYRMARETLLDPARVPPANVVRWRAEDPDLDAAARDYEAALRAGGVGPLARSGAARPRPRRTHGVAVPGHLGAGRGGRAWPSPSTSPQMGTRRLTLTYPALLRRARRLLPGDRARQGAALADGRRRRASARRAHRAAARPRDHLLRSRAPRARSSRHPEPREAT